MRDPRRVESMSNGESRQPYVGFASTTAYPHVSTFRSLQMDVHIYSPSVKVIKRVHQRDTELRAVFGEHDQVRGKVILDPSCCHSGRLSIGIEGAFMYWSQAEEDSAVSGQVQRTGKRKHVFFSSSTDVTVLPGPEAASSRFVLRDAFASRRRPSVSSLNLAPGHADRSYSFAFNLPQSCRPGEEMPSTFAALTETGSSISSTSQSFSQSFEVTYKVMVSWEAAHAYENPSFLEIPILYYPDTDFQSLDAITPDPTSWLEMPLRSDRPIPFRCAITLPTSVTFSRASSIPYFVVFTTSPRSSSLAKEIASDATISISLLQQVTVTEQQVLPPTPPDTPSSSGDEFDMSRSNSILRRVVKTAQPRKVRTHEYLTDFRIKPLPPVPAQPSFSESRTVQNSMCIGFPKRPRHQCDPSQSHPSLESYKSLPDGLQKGKIPLTKTMLPSIDWAGVNVKYYLDVSVLIGQDDLRARIPIRIL